MNKNVVIGFIIIIAIIGIGIAVFIANSNNKQNDTIQNVESNEMSNSEENLPEKNRINENESSEQETANNGKTLIAYFSLPETTGTAEEDSTITVDGQKLGNTQYVANLIQKYTKADIFRIEPVKQYNTSNHQELINDAQEEQIQDARPEIKEKINNFHDYDTIFIGYPIWWSDLPQILYTFLESYDFSGKSIYLFSTNGGSGLAGTVSTITSKLSSARVNANAFKLNRNSMEQAPTEVEKWLNEINIIH